MHFERLNISIKLSYSLDVARLCVVENHRSEIEKPESREAEMGDFFREEGHFEIVKLILESAYGLKIPM